jgi:hypothetical protein
MAGVHVEEMIRLDVRRLTSSPRNLTDYAPPL